MKKTIAYTVIEVLLGLASGALIMYLLMSYVIPTSTTSKINEVKALIGVYSIYDYSESNAKDGMIAGILNGVPDPYARYIPASDYSTEQLARTGHYVGIGVTLDKNTETGKITLAEIANDSPAQRAGLQVGDELIKVLGLEVSNTSIEDVQELIRGEAGSKVELVIFQAQNHILEEYVLERAEIKQKLASSEMIGDVGYLSINYMANGITGEVKPYLTELLDNNPTALVIDVRNNVGGILVDTVELLDLFLPEGKIGWMQGKGDRKLEYEATGEGIDLPLYVIIDSSTVSSAEIFAQALRNNKNAVLVGSTTHGKGIGQVTCDLSDGSAIVLTALQYYDASGYSYHGVGVKPNIESSDPINEVLRILQSKSVAE